MPCGLLAATLTSRSIPPTQEQGCSRPPSSVSLAHLNEPPAGFIVSFLSVKMLADQDMAEASFEQCASIAAARSHQRFQQPSMHRQTCRNVCSVKEKPSVTCQDRSSRHVYVCVPEGSPLLSDGPADRLGMGSAQVAGLAPSPDNVQRVLAWTHLEMSVAIRSHKPLLSVTSSGGVSQCGNAGASALGLRWLAMGCRRSLRRWPSFPCLAWHMVQLASVGLPSASLQAPSPLAASSTPCGLVSRKLTPPQVHL